MKCVREGTPGPEAFALLITTLNREFDLGDCATSLIHIQNFAVSAGKPFNSYLLKYEPLVTDTMHGGTRYFPRQDAVINAGMDNVWIQYSSVAGIVFQKSYASSESFASFTDLWSRLAVHDRGSHVAAAVPQSHLFVTASTRKSRTLTVQSSLARSHVGNVHPEITWSMKARLSNFDSWPASERTWHFVRAICTQSGGIDVPILRETLNPQEYQYLFAQCTGQCLNCGGTGTLMRYCRHAFIGWNYLLNSAPFSR